MPRFAGYLAAAALVLATAGAPGARADPPIAFGVLAFGGEEDARQRWGSTVEALSARLGGRPVDLVPLTLGGVDAALAARGLHFLLTNPGHYQSLMVRHGLAPLVSLQTDGPGRVTTGNRYGAVIFVRDVDGAPERLSDLRGKTFGAVAPDAFGGWQLAQHTMLKNGMVPERELGEIRFFGFPQSAIVDAVLAGGIDAGTVRTGVLEAMIADGRVPEGALKVLNPLEVPAFDLMLSTALVPEWLVAATPQAGPELRRAVARALLTPSGEGGAEFATRPSWIPPQSLAPVVEIRAFLAERAEEDGGLEAFRVAVLGLVVALLALVIAVTVRRRRVLPGTGPRRAEAVAEGGPEAGDAAPSAPLTPREAEILDLVERGQTTKEIARTLDISPKTVEFHRHNLIQKFGAANMADLVRRAALWRATDPHTPQT